LLELNTSNALLTKNKILTLQIETLTAQMAKFPQQLQVVQLYHERMNKLEDTLENNMATIRTIETQVG